MDNTDPAEGKEPPAVFISSFALMKVLHQCRMYARPSLSGQLLGLDIDSKIKVINCFPFSIPQEDARDEIEEEVNGASRQLRALECFGKLGLGGSPVGWYCTVFHGNYWTQSIVETQFNYQINFPLSIVIVCDFPRGADGNISIKALRIKSEFMTRFRDETGTSKFFAQYMTPSSIFDELSINVVNSNLENCILSLLGTPEIPQVPIGLPVGTFFEKDQDELEDISTSQIIDADISLLGSDKSENLDKYLNEASPLIEDYSNEMWRWRCWQRTLSTEYQHLVQTLSARSGTQINTQTLHSELRALPERVIQGLYPSLSKVINNEPGRIDRLMSSSQIYTYSRHLTKIISQSMTKLYLSQSLTKQVTSEEGMNRPLEIQGDPSFQDRKRNAVSSLE